jgi:GNAT superfamily N-acetyltransferase
MTLAPYIVGHALPQEIIDLRHRMLRQGMARTAAMFDRDDDAQTLHAAARVNGMVVGCATYVVSPLLEQPARQLRGMAVATEWQKAGVGRAILSWLEVELAQQSVCLLWCNARKPAVPFYERLGWRVISEQFEIPTAGPHFRMRRDL